MRKGLRHLLVVSIFGFAAAAVTGAIGYELAPRSSTSDNALATASHATAVSDSEVCGLVTADEVLGLLNFPLTKPGPATPQPYVTGGACSWGTGFGESFELTVMAHQPGPIDNPCAGIAGNVIHVGGWVGCSRLEFAPGQVLTAFKGGYTVTIRPETNVIGFRYEAAEESTVSHVFRELNA
jgi:hypothetical protein